MKNDKQNRLKATDKNGVSTEMHYKGIGPEHVVLLLLQMDKGMVNHQAWVAFKDWVDDAVEIVLH